MRRDTPPQALVTIALPADMLALAWIFSVPCELRHCLQVLLWAFSNQVIAGAALIVQASSQGVKGEGVA